MDMKRHRYSFFGQKCGILMDSGDWTQSALFMTFVKKMDSGVWEKPSLKQGKNLKFNLGEILQILQVLAAPGSEWKTVHKFKEDITPITVLNNEGNIQISIPGYGKYMKFPESKVLMDLLTHIYHEKIQWSTGVAENHEFSGSNLSPQNNYASPAPQIRTNPLPPKSIKKPNLTNTMESITSLSEKKSLTSTVDSAKWLENLQVQDEFCLVPGELMAQREKAIAFKVGSFNQIWIPKSCLKDSNIEGDLEGLWIKHWFLTKKLEDIFGAQA